MLVVLMSFVIFMLSRSLWRFLAEFGFILRGELCLQFWVANETLRIRTIVFIAPVAFLLKVGCEFRAALGADVLRDAMFHAPVAVEVVSIFTMIMALFAMIVTSFMGSVLRFRVCAPLVAPAYRQSHYREGCDHKSRNP